MHVLSKSTYIRSLQCQKSLYLYKNYYKERDPVSVNQQLLFNRGHKVGELAHKLFPGGIDVSPSNHFKWAKAAKDTLILIGRGQEIIYEAAFIYEGVLVAVDLLVKSDSGWNAFEVKSNLEVKEVHIRDAAIQYYVITNSGIELNDFSIVHINRNFVKKGEIDARDFFSIKSVLSDCKKEQSSVIKNLKNAKQTLALKETPKVDIGKHCHQPYLCDFYGTCWKSIKGPNIFDLEGIDLETKFNWYNDGIISFDEIMHHQKISKLQRSQILSISKNSAIIDNNKLANYFTSLTYPIHFIDFKSIQAAIPTFEGSAPFQKILFAHSILTKDNYDTSLRHKYFCAEQAYNPSPHLLSNLLDNVQPLGDIFISNKNETLKLLQKQFDSKIHSAKIFDSFMERSKEFYTPFIQAYYYHRSLKSNSSLNEIHAVLINKTNSDLNIFLTEQQATGEYENLVYQSDILKIAETRENIHQYTNARASAMYDIYEYLKSLLNK